MHFCTKHPNADQALSLPVDLLLCGNHIPAKSRNAPVTSPNALTCVANTRLPTPLEIQQINGGAR
jgi:hypothetical protein